MSCGNGGGLRFVFDELNRNSKPCLNLNAASDMTLLTSALTFSNANCIQMDGSCTSRVFASLTALTDPSSIADATGFSDVSDKIRAYSNLLNALNPPSGGTDSCACNAIP